MSGLIPISRASVQLPYEVMRMFSRVCKSPFSKLRTPCSFVLWPLYLSWKVHQFRYWLDTKKTGRVRSNGTLRGVHVTIVAVEKQ